MPDEAGQTHDVTIAGKGYMLAPRGYRRWTEAAAADVPTAGRYRQTAWRRRLSEAADGASVWTSEGFLPTASNAALEIAPAVSWDRNTAGTASVYGGGGDLGGAQYVAISNQLYEITTDVNNNYTGIVPVATALGSIRNVIWHAGHLYISEGANYGRWDGSALTNYAFATELIASYGGLLFRYSAAKLYWTRDEVTWYTATLSDVVTGFLGTEEGLYIGTTRALYRLTGRLVPSNPTTAPTVYDLWDYEIQPAIAADGAVSSENFRSMQAYAGGIYYWLGGWLWRLEQGQPTRQPMRGVLYGLSLAGPYLAAVMWTTEESFQVWLHNGTDWWKLARYTASNDLFAWPVGISNVADAHLVAWNYGTRHLARWNLSAKARTWPTGHATPSVSLPAIDAGAPETTKRFWRIGLELGVPDGPTALAASPATWIVESSTDAGATWAAVGNLTPSALVATGSWPVAIVARRLWLRVRCTGGGPANPALRAVWAAWVTSGDGPQRRRWELRIVAGDGLATLGGGGQTRTGQDIAQELAALVGAGAVTLHDLRYTSATEAATVVVTEAEEVLGEPREPLATEAVVRVVLVEG